MDGEQNFFADENGCPLDDLELEQQIPLMDGGFALLNSVFADGGDRFAVSAVAFDSKEETLWMGNSGGHLTSYCGGAMDKYTSFQAHEQNDIRQILAIDAGVLALSKNHLKCNTRQGIPLFNYTSPNMLDMQCMLLYSRKLSPSGSLLLGGYQPTLLLLDLYELKEVRQARLSEPNCSICRASEKFLFSGDTNGKIAMRNWETLETLQTLDAHGGPLSDFDICGTKLVTCGFSTRSIGGLTCDRFLMVYDLRMLRAVAPIPVNFDPSFIRFLPAYSDSRLLIASQTGSFQVIDIGASAASPFISHVDTQGTALFAVDVSTSKQCIAFGDGSGFVHLFSDRMAPVFNDFSRSTDFPHPVSPLPPISFDDPLTSFSVIPMPLQLPCGRLLSDWPAEFTRCAYRQPLPIDADVLQNMKMVNFIGHASRPSTQPFSNTVPYDLKAEVAAAPRSPKMVKGGSSQMGSDGAKGATDDDNAIVPHGYRKITVRYGRDEPDYRAYNQTGLSALELISPNSYVNPLIQIFFHLFPLRCTIQSHTCRREFCLTCEISFLFHMMQSSDDRLCTASNFLRAFRAMPEVAALGLLLNERDGTEIGTQKNTNLAGLIQGVNLFLLRQMHSELANSRHVVDPGVGVDPDATDDPTSTSVSRAKTETDEVGVEKESPIEALFASSVYFVTRCKCGNETSREDKSMVLTLSPASAGSKSALPTSLAGFASMLEKGFSFEQSTQTWCEKCARFQPSLQARLTKTLPDVLVVNCPVDTERKIVDKIGLASSPSTVDKPCRFGANCIRECCVYKHPERAVSPSLPATDRQHSPLAPHCAKIPAKLSLLLDDETGMIVTKMGDSTQEECSTSSADYELYATVELIREANDQHLVACINTEAGWLLFNDYRLSPVTVKEVVTFDLSWKVPCLLYFMKCGYKNRSENSAPICPVDGHVLVAMDESLAGVRREASLNFTPLDLDEIPKRGDHVALDAEFVTLDEEEAELHSDGTKLTIKPSHLSAARVTVVRGSGPREGTPFIDDYISTQAEVVNYLTKFSGIKPGDLHPSSTSKHLTTLKSTYLKLRCLIDNGVIFVGHGLANDFKVLNLAVPTNQMIDTVQLFRMPNRRMISLRFLAWYFLGVKIQSVTHDSVEDARAALKLYKRYQALISKGSVHFNSVMAELYDKGRTLQWRVPGE